MRSREYKHLLLMGLIKYRRKKYPVKKDYMDNHYRVFMIYWENRGKLNFNNIGKFLEANDKCSV